MPVFVICLYFPSARELRKMIYALAPFVSAQEILILPEDLAKAVVMAAVSSVSSPVWASFSAAGLASVSMSAGEIVSSRVCVSVSVFVSCYVTILGVACGWSEFAGAAG